MATTKAESPVITTCEKTYEGLSASQLIEMYRLMYLSRRLDDREILLKRQQKIFFQISGAGHEALLVAAAFALKPRYDWFYPYYRDRALCLALGMTPLEQLLGAVGAADDPNSGGRQMPSHWGDPRLNIVTGSSPTGTQFLQAVGCAEAGRYFNRHPEAARSQCAGDYRQFKQVRHQPDEVVYVSSGEGTTSEGEFWEAMNAASNLRLPMLFLIEDNEYAISVPVEVQTAGGNISRLVANFPDFHFEECDGCDPLASYCRPAAEQWSTSAAGTARPSCTATSRARIRTRFPMTRSCTGRRANAATAGRTRSDHALPALPDSRGHPRRAVARRAGERRGRRGAAGRRRGLARCACRPRTATANFVYSPDLDPASAAFETKPEFAPAAGRAGAGRQRADHGRSDQPLPERRNEARLQSRGLRRGRGRLLARAVPGGKLVKGKGGVFKLTVGLQCDYGSERVFNSPLAEASIVGRAIGMATRGLKPVVEIQFFDYIWPAMHQLRNELPLIRWRSNGGFSCPMVVRVAIGGYLTGGSIYHSQSGESIFTHTPGMRVVFPSNALDAAGLLRTAIRCDDPVMFLEHKRLYRESFGRAAYPGPDYMIPFGKARVAREGSDLTVITYGATLPRSLQAAQELERQHGAKAEVIDLRTLSPYDWEAIATSVSKTSRALVVHEDMLSWGYGAEIAARIADELFDQLDAPVRRLAAKDTFVAYQPELEDVILPQTSDILAAMLELARY